MKISRLPKRTQRSQRMTISHSAGVKEEAPDRPCHDWAGFCRRRAAARGGPAGEALRAGFPTAVLAAAQRRRARAVRACALCTPRTDRCLLARLNAENDGHVRRRTSSRTPRAPRATCRRRTCAATARTGLRRAYGEGVAPAAARCRCRAKIDKLCHSRYSPNFLRRPLSETSCALRACEQNALAF